MVGQWTLKLIIRFIYLKIRGCHTKMLSKGESVIEGIIYEIKLSIERKILEEEKS